MSLFDAVCHSFATMGTGGFSTHDASIAWFNSPLIEAVAIVFMFLGRRQLFPALRRLAQPRPGRLPAGSGVSRLLPDSPRTDPDRYRLPVRHRALRHGGRISPARGISLRLLHDQYGLRGHRLRSLAGRTAPDTDPGELHRRLRGLNRRRHEGGALAAALQPGRAGGETTGAPGGRDPRAAWRLGRASAGDRGRVGLLRGVHHPVWRDAADAGRQRVWIRSPRSRRWPRRSTTWAPDSARWSPISPR